MFDWGLYLAFVLAIAFGFGLGYRYARQKAIQPPIPSKIDSYYFKGLNLLLDEQPDAAIDSFISALEVNSDTLETHLALGTLLRRRGEVDRAIRIHQNLLARPGLSLQHVQQAQYELATDFIKSGLFDRAENLLGELASKDSPYRVMCLTGLLDIYRDEREWQKGLEVLQALSGSRLSKSYEQWAPIRAHFCCELAEEYMLSHAYIEARQWVKQALSYDKNGVRAALLLGRLEVSAGNFAKAITQLQKAIEQHPDYVGEFIPDLVEAYTQTGRLDDCRSFLSSLSSVCHDAAVVMALSAIIGQQDGERQAAEYVAKEVIRYPSGAGLHKLLEYYLAFTEGNTHEYLLSLKAVVDVVIANNTYYQCWGCGFKGKQLHWLCPSCKSWGRIQPKKEPVD